MGRVYLSVESHPPTFHFSTRAPPQLSPSIEKYYIRRSEALLPSCQIHLFPLPLPLPLPRPSLHRVLAVRTLPTDEKLIVLAVPTIQNPEILEAQQGVSTVVAAAVANAEIVRAEEHAQGSIHSSTEPRNTATRSICCSTNPKCCKCTKFLLTIFGPINYGPPIYTSV